ncbi:unnamed protein product [Notodromas monacha]|uniref:Neurotransmitter-gated ion-channel ligand-binding domain-containing protein n=1 Tax=Notodromas monacha TaxID=399045 RepID=A0A7R9BHF5_9CRUS|nr:unnamed protein product [Notodromas monacha]CAG0914725.1 unnamed protein product [Notodromas monacha]
MVAASCALWWQVLAAICALGSCGNPDAKRLYDDLLSNYNKLVRPVLNASDVLTVSIKIKLSQLIDVDEGCAEVTSPKVAIAWGQGPPVLSKCK